LGRRGEIASAATVRNLVARIPGAASTGGVLLTAHYDSRTQSPGAGDDATGVAAILETVRALRTGPPPRNDVIILLTDAEELGLLGATAFAEGHPWMQDVAVALSVEMRGGGGPATMFETGDGNGWVVAALAEGAPKGFAFSLGTEVYRRMPTDTDFTIFREAGVQGLNFAAIRILPCRVVPLCGPRDLREPADDRPQ
jgi:Zn-dependent M28 family amino/carboxypeptidase